MARGWGGSSEDDMMTELLMTAQSNGASRDREKDAQQERAESAMRDSKHKW